MALRINGEEIEDEVIDSEFSRIKAYHESLGRVSCCERDGEFRRMAKDNIVARVLLLQEAERRGEAVADSQVEEAYGKLIQEHGGAKEHVLLEAGLTLGDEDLFLADLRSNLRMENMLAAVCGEDEPPGEDELRRFYDKHLEHYMTPEEVRAVHIFKSPQPVEKKREIYESMRQARRRALAGEDFLEIAREVSDKPIEEADLGFFKQGEILEDFETIVFSLDTGDTSPVFMTQWGYHLAQVAERREPQPLPFDDVRERVGEDLRLARRRERVDAFVRELRGRADIADDDPDDEEENSAAHAHAH